MSLAAKILIAGGVFDLAYGMVLGAFFVFERQKHAHGQRYLVIAHKTSFMQGAMLLALVFALELSPLAERVETFAAALLVTGTVLFEVKDTVNWLQGVEDEFEERPVIGRLLGGLGIGAAVPGLSIMVIGVVRGLGV